MSDPNIMIGLNDIIKKYDNLTYFDQYSGSVVLFLLMTIIVILLVSYFHTIINVQPVINDWANQRCKPTIIPFAGLINPPEGVSASEYTSENFNYCTQNLLSGVTSTALEPLSFVTNALTSLTGGIMEDINSSRGIIYPACKINNKDEFISKIAENAFEINSDIFSFVFFKVSKIDLRS